jgi:quinolinate synthase
MDAAEIRELQGKVLRLREEKNAVLFGPDKNIAYHASKRNEALLNEGSKVKVPPEVAKLALRPIERMLEMSK